MCILLLAAWACILTSIVRNCVVGAPLAELGSQFVTFRSSCTMPIVEADSTTERVSQSATPSSEDGQDRMVNKSDDKILKVHFSPSITTTTCNVVLNKQLVSKVLQIQDQLDETTVLLQQNV